MHNSSSCDEEKNCADCDKDDSADVRQLAPLENGATMKQLNGNYMESNNTTTECCDVILEKCIGLKKRGIVIDTVKNGLPCFRRDIGGGARQLSNVICNFCDDISEVVPCDTGKSCDRQQYDA